MHPRRIFPINDSRDGGSSGSTGWTLCTVFVHEVIELISKAVLRDKARIRVKDYNGIAIIISGSGHCIDQDIVRMLRPLTHLPWLYPCNII